MSPKPFSNKKFGILSHIPNVKFVRKRTFVSNNLRIKKTEYVIEFILTDGVITESFKTENERNKFHEHILRSIEAVKTQMD